MTVKVIERRRVGAYFSQEFVGQIAALRQQQRHISIQSDKLQYAEHTQAIRLVVFKMLQVHYDFRLQF